MLKHLIIGSAIVFGAALSIYIDETLEKYMTALIWIAIFVWALIIGSLRHAMQRDPIQPDRIRRLKLLLSTFSGLFALACIGMLAYSIYLRA